MAKHSPKSPGTALITGGSKRIGQAIALSLADLGYNIALHYNGSKDAAQQLVRFIRKKKGTCETFAADLSDRNDTLSLIETVHKRFPDLNLLINNASIFKESQLSTSSLAHLEEHWTVNLKAPYILICEFARNCHKGNIINILDTHIVQNRTTHLAYLLSKKSLADLTKMAAVSLAPKIRVNGIAPGNILPPAHKSNSYLDRLAKNIPLQRKGDLSHIARSVRFLLDNDYVTGQILYNDGGEHLI